MLWSRFAAALLVFLPAAARARIVSAGRSIDLDRFDGRWKRLIIFTRKLLRVVLFATFSVTESFRSGISPLGHRHRSCKLPIEFRRTTTASGRGSYRQSPFPSFAGKISSGINIGFADSVGGLVAFSHITSSQSRIRRASCDRKRETLPGTAGTTAAITGTLMVNAYTG